MDKTTIIKCDECGKETEVLLEHLKNLSNIKTVCSDCPVKLIAKALKNKLN